MVAMTIDSAFIFTVGTRVKECFKKKQKELLSSLMTLHIPSFGITVGPNSYIGSDRMLQTIADLWELPRNNAEKTKVICLCIRTLGPYLVIISFSSSLSNYYDAGWWVLPLFIMISIKSSHIYIYSWHKSEGVF